MADSLPSTEQLLDLRKRLVSGDSLVGIECSLKARRESMVHTLAAGGVFELSREFRAVWAVLADAPASSWFYVPPIYEDESLEGVLTVAITQVCQRERGLITDSTNNVGHMVFGGIEGTGKTTLLRALVIGTAVLLSRMVPVTHSLTDGDNESLPASWISRANVTLHGGGARLDGPDSQRGLSEALAELREGDHELLLAVDEFQHVFALEPLETRRVRTIIASHVKTLSRSFGTFGVIAGSSADMRVLMFRSGTVEAPDPWRRAGFPDFNASLYTLFEVPALRSATALRRFLHARYPAWEVDDTDVAELLHWTGGIGRSIHAAWVSSGAPTSKARLHGVSLAVRALQVTEGTDGTRRLPPSCALDERPARVAVTAIVMRHEYAVIADAVRERHVLPCIGIPRSMLLQVMRSLGVDAAETQVRRLVDLSVLYSAAGDVQLARPCDARVYAGAGVPSSRHLLLLTAVEMMVQGVPSGADDGDECAVDAAVGVTHLNAGNILERLVRGRVVQLMHLGASASVARCDGWRIDISGGILCVRAPESDTWQPLTPDLLVHGVAGQLLQWRRETGLDGVLVVCKVDPAASVRAAPIWLLHCWQCKGGQRAVEVTGGALETSVKAYVASKVVSELNPNCSHGILVKAQVGICKLLLAWRATMEAAVSAECARPLLVPATLLITTTKDARLARRSIDAASGVMFVDPRVAATAGVPKTTWAQRAISSPIAICLLDGVGWLHHCVPADVAALAREVFVPDVVSEGGSAGGAGTGLGRPAAGVSNQCCVRFKIGKGHLAWFRH